MNKRLLDILVCPFDKVTPLQLFELEMKAANPVSAKEKKVLSNDEGSFANIDIKKSATGQTKPDSLSESNTLDIVIEGILICKTCTRYYPIIEEIPIILPDDLRDKKKDIEFLTKWSKSIPQDLLKSLRPWTI